MTRTLSRCPTCHRQVTLVNDRYPLLATRLRAHYPKPYTYYEKRNQPLPNRYCPGNTPRKDNP